MAQLPWPIPRRSRPLPFAALVILIWLCLVIGPGLSAAGDGVLVEDAGAPRLGWGLGGGWSYDPEDAEDFVLVTGFALYDYEDVWGHAAPAPLRFKVEAMLGSTMESSPKLTVSVGGLALYYLDGLKNSLLRPYVEAGVGVIYTEHRVRGQGTRLNFNPQAGIGFEFSGVADSRMWMSLRLHHLSNAGLHKENRGVNSVVLLSGWYF